jgi:hypothetical protein
MIRPGRIVQAACVTAAICCLARQQHHLRADVERHEADGEMFATHLDRLNKQAGIPQTVTVPASRPMTITERLATDFRLSAFDAELSDLGDTFDRLIEMYEDGTP